jgi:hypothetical protein
MSPDLFPALLDPTLPLPPWWPSGALGAFLMFLLPVGGGIPAGVLMARDGGVFPLVTALLYLVSDVIFAFLIEPFLILARRLGQRVGLIGRLGRRLAQLTNATGLRGGGARGPLGLILVSFTVDPITGRVAAAAAGHGFVPGWMLAIAGDMLYFGLLMASTLWLSSVIGDERLTLGVVLLGMWLVPMLLRRRAAAPATPPPAPGSARSAPERSGRGRRPR